MDFQALAKDAVSFGLTVGIIAAALFIIWAYGEYLAVPKVTVAAATPKPPVGFQLPY